MMHSRKDSDSRVPARSYSDRSGDRKPYKMASGRREGSFNRDKYGNSLGGSSTRQPTILTKPKLSEPMLVPGKVSIISRDQGPGISPTMRTVSDESERETPLSASPPARIHGREDGSYMSTRSRRDNASSSFVPLQPKHRSHRDRGDGGRESGGLSRGDTALFSMQTPESTHSVKLLDESWIWSSRGSDLLMDQPDFLVVGCLGLQGVGKSAVMSLLAGNRTGSGRPNMFRQQSKDVQDQQGYQTAGIDVAVTGERIILLDTQPILSGTMMDRHAANEGVIPSDMTPEIYIEIQSLQLAILLMSVCHVIVVVMDTMEADTTIRFLCTAASLKPSCVPTTAETTSDTESLDEPAEYYPHIVFVHNHATPDDFQPYSLKQVHNSLAQRCSNAPFKISSGVSLLKSGVIPMGNLPSKFSNAGVNLHLLPTQEWDSGSAVSRPEKLEFGLNPILKLLPQYTGHPSYQLLAETLRNQIFSMPRSPLSAQFQQMNEKDWFTFAEETCNKIKKSDLLSKYDELLQNIPDEA